MGDEKNQESEREDRFIIVRREVLEAKDLSSSEKLVYARICGFKKYFESAEECGGVLGISKNTVIKAKQKLIRLGYVREIGNTGRGKIYQSVYDDNTRVVKTTSQSGRKLPVRVVDSTTIDEIENKKRVKSITNVIGETPENKSNIDINDMFSLWNDVVGYEIVSNKQKNRYACNNLLKKHGKDKLTQLLNGVRLSQSDKYAPRISDFVSLQSKLSELLAWGNRQSLTRVKGIIKI